MKNLFLIIILIAVGSTITSAQDIAYRNIDKYKNNLIQPGFKDFIEDKDVNNFKRLREFLNEKEDLLTALNREILNYESLQNSKEKLAEVLEEISEKHIKSDSDSITMNISRVYEILNIPYYYYYKSAPAELNRYQSSDLYLTSQTNSPKFDGENLISQLTKDLVQINKKQDEEEKLSLNIKNIKDDIYSCQVQIDSTLAPEYKKQEFRSLISLFFTALIAIVLITFFFIVYKKSDDSLSKDLLSGYGLQFITLFVLIIAIVLFGILGILGGSELAAILSGISGYVLGKGTDSKGNNHSMNNESNSTIRN